MKKLLLSLLFLNLFCLQSYLIRFKIGPYPSNLQEILIILNLVPFLFLVLKKEIQIKTPKILLSFLILFFTSSIIVQIYDTEFFFRYWKFFIFASTLIIIFSNTLKSESEKEKGIEILSLGAICFGILSLILNLIGINNTFDSRLIGPLDSAVYLAVYISPLLIFNFSKFLKTLKQPYFKNKYANYTILLAILLVLTKSMGAIIGVSAVSSIIMYKKFRQKLYNNKIKKTIIILLFLILSSSVYYTKILPTLQTTWSSLDERNEIYMTSNYILKTPKNAILGLGIGQFQYHYEKNVETAINNKALNYKVLQPHNIYLLFIFNFGILGAFFLTGLIFYTLRTIFREDKINFKLIASLAVCYFFIHGIMDTPFMKNDLLFLFLLFLEEEF